MEENYEDANDGDKQGETVLKGGERKFTVIPSLTVSATQQTTHVKPHSQICSLDTRAYDTYPGKSYMKVDPERTIPDKCVVPRNKKEENVCQIWAEILRRNVHKVGTHDDFFRLGNEESKVFITIINQPRSYLTVSDIGHIISQERLDALQDQREIEAVYLANSFQQGFIYRALNHGDVDDDYVVQVCWQYHQSIKINNLKQAWEYAKAKFRSLRLRFDWQEELIQIIDKEVSLDWRYIDLTDESNTQKQENIIKALRDKDRLERYDLARGTLFRIYLIKLNKDLYDCIFSNHHAILDSWSMPILLKYVHDIYLRLDREERISVEPDCVYEAAQHYIQEHQKNHKAFWGTYIAQIEERSDFCGLLLRHENLLKEYKHVLYPTDETFTITGNLFKSLKFLSQHEGVTLNVVLQFVWHKVLSVYGNSKQTIVGTTFSGRNLPVEGIEKLVGLYANTLPLIVNHQADKSLIESIKDIQSCNIEFNGRSSFNVAELQPSNKGLFDSIFDYHNFLNRTNFAQDKIKLKFKGSVQKFDHPLIVRAYESNDELTFDLQYAGDLFSKDTINHLLQLTKTLLEQLPGCAHQAVSNLNFLNKQQFDQIIYSWNATDKEYPADTTIHGLFEKQVAKTPNNIAIVYKEVKLTYRELNERSNKLASHLLAEFKIEPDNLIPLCLDRSEHMLIAILAVLKSGGAYVPIDPSFPDERIQSILEDAGASFLLTNEIHQERLQCITRLGMINQKFQEASTIISVLSIESRKFQDKLLSKAVTNPKNMTRSTHLACVVYTSGTTGKPKGAMIEHRGLVNLNYDLIKSEFFNDANEEEVILQFSNYAFGASLHQIILGILNGYVLLLIPNQLWFNKKEFNDYLIMNKVTHITATPRFLEQQNFSEISTLKRIICGGESLPKQSYDKIPLNNKFKVIIAFGLTEIAGPLTLNVVKQDSYNICSPISKTKCYVLGDNLLPLPIGVIGELYIGGDRLARGYLNRPDLTAERFISNPFQTEEEKRSLKNARLYKTGDLVRWLPDGNLEYIGRNDHQVKIRGFRIELGEIETALLGYKGIQQSVALAKEHKNAQGAFLGFKYLVGYYVSDTKLDEEAILRYLESKLPEYMIPVALVHIKILPLTINGKLDRAALPDSEFTFPDKYVAPRNQTEEKACQIWAEVLGLNVHKVGIHDDFFKLGGDSITIIQLVSRLQKSLQLNVSVKDILSHKSIERLYENLLSKQIGMDRISIKKTEQGVLVGAVPLLPIQEWFFWRDFSSAHHWNQSFLIKTPRLDLRKLQDSLGKLVQHHDGFRLRYRKDEKSNTYEQYYNEHTKVETIKVFDVKTIGYQENCQTFQINLQELLTRWQSNFDLTEGPIYSVGYIHGYQDNSTRIYFALHQLIVDTMSWHILSEDLKDLYDGKKLGNKGSSYREWAEVVREYPSKYQEEKTYWKNILSDYDSSNLNTFVISESTAHFASIKLSEEHTTYLLQESNQTYNTQINDLLLTAFGYSLAETTGCNINYIALEGHGRKEIDRSMDITKTLGCFTSIYPVRLEVSNSLSTSIKATKEYLRAVPNKGLGYGPILGYKSNALPRISFNYSGQVVPKNRKNLNDLDNWQISVEDSGISRNHFNRDNNVININGQIIEGRVRFNLVSKLNEEITKKLARVFEEHLLAIINHCKTNTTIEYTMSDFKDFEPYILLNQETVGRDKLFMFPPINGGAESYLKNVVPRLRNKILIMFNNFYKHIVEVLGYNYASNITIEKLAEDYVAYIKLIQPKGPYHFFGWSFGGVLAFEISKQLTRKNEFVANLILVDSYFDVKNTALKTNSISWLNRILSKYSAALDIEMPYTNIILYKATKVEEINLYPSYYNYTECIQNLIEKRNLDTFYAENTEANNLEKLLPNHKIKVIPMNSSHFNWINDDEQVEAICIGLEEL